MPNHFIGSQRKNSDHAGSSIDFKPFKHSFKPFSLPQQKAKPLELHQIQEIIEMGFPVGLAQVMGENNTNFPLRIWIIDNSRSMQKDDGRRISMKPAGVCKVAKSSRWKEIRDTIYFHAETAAKVQAPTIFRLLNKPFSTRLPREFGVARGDANATMRELQVAQETLKEVDPKGCTPLTKRVLEIRENIFEIKDQLEANGQRVVVVLATDGIPTNRDGESTRETRDNFVEALKSLNSLPVWIIVRLCTQADHVVKFYEALNQTNGLYIEVLDDYFSEAQDLCRYNKWVNYALPLHRAREMGVKHHMFDLLIERKLTLSEVKEYFAFLFGKEIVDSLPDPCQDFHDFLLAASKLLADQPNSYNPIKKKVAPLVDLKKLASAYRGTSSCSIM
jgi:hypothetical protein